MLYSKQKCETCGLLGNHGYIRSKDQSIYYSCKKSSVIEVPRKLRQPTFHEKYFDESDYRAPLQPTNYSSGSNDGYGLCRKCHQLGDHFVPGVSEDIGYFKCRRFCLLPNEPVAPIALPNPAVHHFDVDDLPSDDGMEEYGLREPDDELMDFFVPAEPPGQHIRNARRTAKPKAQLREYHDHEYGDRLIEK